MLSILCEFFNVLKLVQLLNQCNYRSYICQNMIINHNLHGNYCFPYTSSHVGCHLEFLKLFNGDEMSSIGFFNGNKNATKLFGLRNSLGITSFQ